MKLKAHLLASALVISAAPAFAQSANNEVGALSFGSSTAGLGSVATKDALSFPNAGNSAQASPQLSFAGSQNTVSRNTGGGLGTGRDWTGFYVGGQVGYASVDTSLAGNDEDIIGGIIAGYDFDLGNVVVGGGLDYDFADISLAGGVADLENVFRVRGRVGYKIGDGLIYAAGGYALADTDTLGSDDGYFIGAGYEHFVTQNFTLGGEVLYHDFGSFNSTGVNVDATTVQIRGTFRF